ncbi:extracellular solute-binding protein [Rhodococcus sp. NPDC057529]|uniref:extracellular solute-binding protein n=1 Tax=Rhodococcus sp. NPDC057529 TaxID=3346158 RepID=UPI00366CF1F7
MTEHDLHQRLVVSRRTALGWGLGGALGLLVAACSPRGNSDASVPDIDVGGLNSTDQELLAKAQQEGTVTLYTSTPPGILDQVVAALAQLNIAVVPQRLNSSQLSQRFSAEAAVGKANADVVMISDPALVPGWSEKGWLAKVESQPAMAQWPTDFKDPYYSIVAINPEGIGVNTNMVDATSAEDWTFLLDPQFNGNALTLDLKNVGGVAFYFWHMIRETYGDGFLQKFAAQRPRLIDSGPSGAQQLAAGGSSLFLPCSQTNVNDQTSQGAPVRGLLPTNAPIMGAESAAAISSTAPHPNAARFLFSFLMSTQGQQILNTAATGTSSPNATTGCPPLPANYVRPAYAVASTPSVQRELISLLGM